MSVLYTNNASTTLATGITSSSTSISVSSGKGSLFPAISGSDFFYVTLTNTAGTVEIVKVTARSTDTLTVVRGQDGTTAAAWNAGDKVELRITKGLLDQLKLDATKDTASNLSAHTSNTSNPHSVTATQVGLGNVTNESKATMFTSPTFTGNAVLGTPASGNFSTGTFTWPTFNQSTSGNAATATALQTARTLTIGSTGKTFNGSANVSWSLAEIGAQAALPAGTAMLFAQTAAPTGWTKVTTHNDKALRVVSGTAGSGGSTAFSSVFASRTPAGSISTSVTVNSATAGGSVSTSTSIDNATAGGSVDGGVVSATTLSEAQIPAHRHVNGAWGEGGHNMYGNAAGYSTGTATRMSHCGGCGNSYPFWTQTVGSTSSHTHGFTNPSFTGTAHNHTASSSSTFTGSSHNHTASASSSFSGSSMDFAVQYVDVIIATKD